MKVIEKWSVTLIVVFIMTSCSTPQKTADRYTRQWRYELEAVSVGVQGTYLLKVWSYSGKANIAIEQAKKNAVHGVIFTGFTGANGVSGQKSLATNPNLEEEKKDFFKAFFANGGKYMKFVTVTNDGSIAAKDRLKVGRDYKIGVVVSVNVAALRKDLEDAGIIRKLGAGFAK